MRKLALLVLVVLVLAVACAPAPEGNSGETQPEHGWITWERPWSGGIARFHDDEKNVTCWVYEAYYKGGLSCIPDQELE